MDRVHDKRPVTGDRFVQRFARYQQEANRLVISANLDIIPVAEDNKLGVGKGFPRAAKEALALKDVGKGVVLNVIYPSILLSSSKDIPLCPPMVIS